MARWSEPQQGIVTHQVVASGCLDCGQVFYGLTLEELEEAKATHTECDVVAVAEMEVKRVRIRDWLKEQSDG